MKRPRFDCATTFNLPCGTPGRTADLPAFAKPGQRIDITVSTIGKAKSLRGGALILTPLYGADGQIYAMAQGNLAVGGLGISAKDGSQLTVNVPTVGRIAEVDDLVGVYHFLVSDQSRYVTGHTMVVDGGRLTGYRKSVLAMLAP